MEVILADYREHCDAGRSRGHADAEICKRLGNPKVLAQSHVAQEQLESLSGSSSTKDRSKVLVGSLKAVFILAPLNILLFFGPFLIVASCLFVGWLLGAVFLGTSVYGFVVWFWTQALALNLGVGSFSTLFLILSAFFFSLLWAYATWLITEVLVNLLVRYFRWNFNFVLNKKGDPHYE